MHFTLDFQEKMSTMKILSGENGTFWRNQNFFFVVFENLTLLSATFMDRMEEKVLPRNIWSAFRKTGMDYAPIS